VRVPIEGVKAYLKDCLAKGELVGLAG